MLDDLINVITTLQQRLREHGEFLRNEGGQREARTRTTLINPLLQVLGWDPADPSLVTLEYRAGVGWADYALKGPGNRPAAVIEAKRLGTSVENHLDQAVTYCIQQGIAYAGVTDGNHWQLYRTFDQRPLAEKIVLDVRIDNTPAHECALQLLLLWRPNSELGKAVEAKEPILRDEFEPPPPPSPPPSGQEDKDKDWIALDSFIQQNPTKQPVSIRFPDGTQSTVVRWYDLVTLTARWLWSSDKLTHANVPVPTSGKGNGYLLALQGHTLNSNQSLKATEIHGTPLWFDRQGSGYDFRQRTLSLLAHCKVDPAMVKVQVEE